MQCAHHPFTKAVGYCTECGEFGCDSCLFPHDGAKYCKKHFKPIAEKIAHRKHLEEVRRSAHRHRLEVHTHDGEILRGFAFHLNPDEAGFRLDLATEKGELTGEADGVAFEACKAIYTVKSFDGRFDRNARFDVAHPMGDAVVIQFKDGDILRGKTLRPYRVTDKNFHVLIEDVASNNVSVLVFASAVARVFSEEEYHSQEQAERDRFVGEHMARGETQEEALGGYYFAQHDYHRAIQNLAIAHERDPNNPNVASKLAAAEYNLGVRYIRKHNYPKALQCMERALQLRPGHEKALEKAEKLRSRV
jgi:tetratricopeptide (TPR) repeat protein